jgi:hypothetical protein
VERFIEGEATPEELEQAGMVTYYGASEGGATGQSMELVRWTVGGSQSGAALRASSRAVWAVERESAPIDGAVHGPAAQLAAEREQAAQAALLRDIFGNPFRPVTFSPAWRTDTAVSLAQHIYESREFSAMPILADALQDAGCDNEDILSHCCSIGPHVRGCWVVDLVLGKE